MVSDSTGDASLESDVHSGVDRDGAITGSPSACYEGNLSMHPATDDKGDIEVDGCQGDLSMHPATDDKGDVEDGCQGNLSMCPTTDDEGFGVYHYWGDLSMHLTPGDEEDKVDDPADVYEAVTNAGANLPDVNSSHHLQNSISMICPVAWTLKSSVVM